MINVYEVATMPKAKDPRNEPPDGAPPAPAPVAGRKPRKTEAAFDVWLQRGLHEIYDKVASEPIPDELLKLIEEDRAK